jgi:nucleoside-diphosphate-sugar epimerase
MGILKVLLTGATGFIGSHMARLLVADGRQVHAVVRPGGDLWRINDLAASVEVLPCDLSNTAELERHLDALRPDVCLHFAWQATTASGALTAAGNVQALNDSLQLALRLERAGCRKLVVAGTCFEYDTSIGYLSESSPTRPHTLYGATKLGLYQVLERLCEVSEMELAWLRFFYLYGPFEDERRLVPSIILSLLEKREAKVTPGRQVRDYLHVEDAARATLAVVESDLTGVFNIASGAPVTVRDVVSEIGALLGRQDLLAFGALPYKEADPMFVCANNERLLRQTSWAPLYDLENGLRQTAAWWADHRGVSLPVC